MGLLDDLGDVAKGIEGGISDVTSGLGCAVDGASNLLGAAAPLLGDVAGFALGGPAGSLLAPMFGSLIGGAAGELPQIFKGLLSGLNPAGQFACPSAPYGFSPQCSGLPLNYLTNPGSVLSGIGSATNTLGSGLNGIDISGIGAGLDQQMTDAVNQAQSGKMQDVLAAQQKMMQVQVTFQTLSNFIQTIGKLESEAVTNSKLQ